MPATLPVVLALFSPEVQKKTNGLLNEIQKLICRTHSPCGPKFIQAIQRTGGFVGYRRGTTTKWNYYLPNGIHLSWDLGKATNAQNWYLGSGYWEKLKNAGLDSCCLRSKYPPSEAFPLAQNKPIVAHRTVKLPNGSEFEVDPEKFDLVSWQNEVDEYFATTKDKGGAIIVDTGGGTVTPSMQGSPLMPMLLLLAAWKGFGT
jgi:hypothetical protein